MPILRSGRRLTRVDRWIFADRSRSPVVAIHEDARCALCLSPVCNFFLGVLAVAAFVWASAPLLGPKARAYGGLFFACQSGIIPAYNPGHVDHQALMLIGFTVLIGVFLRITEGKISDRAASWGGAVGGLFLWVSIEALLQLTVFNIVLYVFGSGGETILPVPSPLSGGVSWELLPSGLLSKMVRERSVFWNTIRSQSLMF